MDDWENLSEEELDERIAEAFAAAVDKSFRTLNDHRRVTMVREWRKRRAFEQRLAAYYAPAFELFDHFLVSAHGVGKEANERLRAIQTDERDYVIDVLTRLHARACLVASEVRALMFSGHASGALARWRTLHEIAVVANFVRQEGNLVAERYLMHDAIRRAKALRQYMEHQKRLGVEPVAPDVAEVIFRVEKELVGRFGREFKSDWGWAIGTMPGTPHITRIEKKADMGHWRPHFAMASHSVHAGYAGSIADIGYGPFSYSDFALSGPSDAGISEPAQCTLLDLYSSTVALATYKMNDRQYVQLRVLDRYRAKCIDTFVCLDRLAYGELF